MWKILLVEDKVFVGRKLIQWDLFGYTVSGEASNGREALELMAEDMPDLVIDWTCFFTHNVNSNPA